MTITTKFSIGDSVWVMKDNKPYVFRINGIYVSVIESPSCNYEVLTKSCVRYSDPSTKEHFFETDCYASKEELLASL